MPRAPQSKIKNQKSKTLTHLDAHGRARMVDVGHKPIVRRTAVAAGEFVAAPATLDRLLSGNLPKGEALAVARIAGIAAAKRTDELIPLCHSLPLDHASVDFERTAPDRVTVTASASLEARTGVEMEALTAVSVACLTLYDMTKAVDKALRIDNVRLLEKRKDPLPSPSARP
jgi:cyclic pyranopterin phosphate synthase